MSLEIKNSLTYPLKDIAWKSKVFVGGLLMFAQVLGQIFNENSKEIAKYFKTIPSSELTSVLPFLIPAVLILAVVIVVTSLFTSAYFAKNINMRILRPEAELPRWDNWKDLLFIGLKGFGAVTIYSSVFLVIGLILVSLLFLFKANSLLMALLVIALLIPVILIFSILLAISNMAFATDLKFASFFNFKLMNNLLKNNLAEFFIVVLLSAALGVIVGIASTILQITIIGIVLIPFAMFYQFLIAGDLNAQFIRNSINKTKKAIE